MNLQEHRGVHARVRKRPVHRDHRQLHEVGRAALQRRVGRFALRRGAHHVIGGRERGHVAPASEDRRDVAVGPSPFQRSLDIGADRREAREVRRRDLLGLRAVDFQTLRQTEVRHAVEQAEVYALGQAALVVVHRRSAGNGKDLAGGKVVNVLAFVKGAPHRLVSGKMRHNPQLDLAVIRGEQHVAVVLGHEGAANATSQLAAYRNVLQVRTRGRKAPGCGRGLVEDGSQTSV